jgi:hypothetical protein
MKIDKKNRTNLWKLKIRQFSIDNNIGFREINHYHFSLYNGFLRIDFFPQSSKYHDVKNGKRGIIVYLDDFLKKLQLQ